MRKSWRTLTPPFSCTRSVVVLQAFGHLVGCRMPGESVPNVGNHSGDGDALRVTEKTLKLCG